MRVVERSGWLSWLRWRSAGTTPLVGVDIAPDAVRIIELQASARGLRIAHHAELPLDASAWQAAMEGEPQALTEALRRAVQASGTRLRNAALALPASAVITRTLSLPQPAHDEELELLVEADAAQSLPFPREEISLDFSLLGPSANDEGMVDVLLVAARSERIAQRVAWAEAAGLDPLVVGVESQALVAAIARLCGDPCHLESILHFSGEGTHCLFVRGEHLLFERELGKSLPSAIGSRLGDNTAAIDHWLDSASLEWQRHAQLFAAAAPDGEIGRIHLAGSGTLGALLAAGLRHRLGIDVDLPDPFLHWPGAQRRIMPAAAHASDQPANPHDHDGNDSGSGFLLAAGLALRGLAR